MWTTDCSTAGLCCDANCTNQLWDVNTDGSITTPYYPKNNNAAGPYLTLDIGVNSLFIEEKLNGQPGDPLRDPARQVRAMVWWVWCSTRICTPTARPRNAGAFCVFEHAIGEPL